MDKTLAKVKNPLLVVLIIGLGLRLIGLSQSFWLDEASQAQMSSLSLEFIWSGRQGDFHPPLFYLITHFWLMLGKSEIFLRLPSVLFGLINIIYIHRLAMVLLSGSGFSIYRFKFSPALVAAFLLAINPFHIYYSQEFRSYSLLCLLGTMSVYYLYNRKYLWAAVLNALLLYTHYSSLFLILTELIYVLIYKKSYIKPFLLSLLFSLLLYIPWLPQLAGQLGTGINIDTYLPGWRNLLSISPLKILPVTIFKLVAGRITFLSSILYIIYMVFVFVVTFLSFRAAKVHRNFLFSWVFTPILLIMLFSLVFPQNQPFRLIYILPGLVLIFTQACMRYPRLFITLFIYIALVGNVAYYTRPRLQREQWRQAITFLRQQESSETGIVIKFPDKFAPIYWYDPGLQVISAVPTFPAKSDEVSEKLSVLTSPSYRQVYMLEYLTDITDPSHHVESTLVNLGFVPGRVYDFTGVGFIRQYIRP